MKTQFYLRWFGYLPKSLLSKLVSGYYGIFLTFYLMLSVPLYSQIVNYETKSAKVHVIKHVVPGRYLGGKQYFKKKVLINTEFDIIIKRVDSLQKVNSKFPEFDNEVTTLLGLFQSNGSFSDLNYGDNSQNFLSIPHIEKRLINFAIAYTSPASNYYQNAILFKNIVKGLRFWYMADPKSIDWFYNDVRSPTALGKILCIMRQGNLAVPVALEDSIMTGGGTNRGMNRMVTRNTSYGVNQQVFNYPYGIRGALQKNAIMVNDATKKIYEVIKVVAPYAQGIQPDNSFLQHGPQMYIGAYGNPHISYSCAVIFTNTSYSIPQEKLDILSKYYKDTWLKSIRGKFFDFSTIGRALVYQTTFQDYKTINEMIISGIKNAKAVDPTNSMAWDAAIVRNSLQQKANYMIKPEHKRYWNSDYDLHIRPAYSFNVRTVSNRTYRTERGNNENVLGRYLSDGQTSILRNGGEYDGLFAVWEWDKIPGVTSRDFTTDRPITVDWGQYGSTSFVGGVSDSLYGVTAYSQNFDNVFAEKAWFFFDKEVVCLGAGINSTSNEVITTTLNQTALLTPVFISNNNMLSVLGNNSVMSYNNLKWTLQDSVGYFFPAGGDVTISNVQQTGNYHDINFNAANVPAIPRNVFKLWFNHGMKPVSAGYAYIVVPGIANAAEMNAYNMNDIFIISNTSSIQAVKHKRQNIIQAVFLSAGTFTDTLTGMKVKVDGPCVIMIKNLGTPTLDVSIADPTQVLPSINLGITFPGKAEFINKMIVLPANDLRGSSKAFFVNINDVSEISGG